MTTDRDFKKLVRGRMSATGQPYAAARADLLATPPPSWPTTADTVADATGSPIEPIVLDATARPFFDGDRLRSIPTKRRARAAVLLALVQRFEPGRVYAEREVNEVLRAAHEDFAWLRRELVNYRYLAREDGRYRVVTTQPERDANEAQEVPASDAAWFAYAARAAGGHSS